MLKPHWPVLVVDDEENQLIAIDITLRSAGYNNLRTCSDSRKVMSMLRDERFGLVILDLHMPHVTGLDIITQSAALENRPPIVVVTGSPLIRDFADRAAGGVTDYLAKPVEREQLLAVVHRVLADSTAPHRDKPAGDDQRGS
jgi:DNA-binding NtrC family response regulator